MVTYEVRTTMRNAPRSGAGVHRAESLGEAIESAEGELERWNDGNHSVTIVVETVRLPSLPGISRARRETISIAAARQRLSEGA